MKYSNLPSRSFIIPFLLIFNHLLLFGNISFSQVREEWVKKYNGSSVEMVVDDSGNSILTGMILGYGNVSEGIFTSKYDKGGNLMWTKLFKNKPKSVDAPEDIAVDKIGNVYITGTTDDTLNGESNQLYLTIKYNPEGEVEWVQTFDTTGSQYEVDFAHSIAVDNWGNVYVTGESIGILTIKYNSQGKKLWVASFPGTNYGEKVELDNEGNVYVFGTVVGFGTLDLIIIKYDTSGNQLWTNTNTGFGGILHLLKPMVIDNESNVYSVSWEGTVKYDKNGNFQWKTDNNVTKFTVVSVDSSGNLYHAGTRRDQQVHVIVVEKYNKDGEKMWTREYSGPANMDGAYDIVNDPEGNSYVTGVGNSTLTNRDIITLKYDSTGQLKWEMRYDASESDYPKTIKIDNQKNVLVLGNTYNTDQTTSQLLIKYSQLTLSYGLCCFDIGHGSQAICGKNINPLSCTRSGNNAFFAGYVEDCSAVDTIAICDKTRSTIRINANYLEELNAVKLTWNKESSAPTTGFYVQRSKDGIEYKTVGFINISSTNQYEFKDPYPEIENHYKIVWFEPRGYESNKVLAVALPKEKIQVFPNPAVNKVRIVLKDLEEHNSNLIVTDDMGRVKLSRRLFKGTTPEIDVSNLPAGIYLIRIDINGKAYRQRFVKR